MTELEHGKTLEGLSDFLKKNTPVTVTIDEISYRVVKVNTERLHSTWRIVNTCPTLSKFSRGSTK